VIRSILYCSVRCEVAAVSTSLEHRNCLMYYFLFCFGIFKSKYTRWRKRSFIDQAEWNKLCPDFKLILRKPTVRVPIIYRPTSEVPYKTGVEMTIMEISWLYAVFKPGVELQGATQACVYSCVFMKLWQHGVGNVSNLKAGGFSRKLFSPWCEKRKIGSVAS
jgi:hypothetical protein